MTMRERKGMTPKEIKESSERLRIDMIRPASATRSQSDNPAIRNLGNLIDGWIMDAPQTASDPKMNVGKKLLKDIYDLQERNPLKADQAELKDMDRRLTKVLFMKRPKDVKAISELHDKERTARGRREEVVVGFEKNVNKWLASPPLYLQDDSMVEGKNYLYAIVDRIQRWPDGDQKDRLKVLRSKLTTELNTPRLKNKDALSRRGYEV